MVSEGRQKIIEGNRSLRLIKNELESLLEKGLIDEDAFDNISRLLPTESSISNAATPAQREVGLPTPAPSSVATPSPASPPTNAMNNMSLSQGPPSYSQSTGGGPPPLPGRNNPPPPPPSKPVIANARALYKYAASDARDCSFERDDRIAVYEYMNADWWMGRNQRTGQEGIFPKNYVEVEGNNPPPPGPPANSWGVPVNEKAGIYPPPGQQPGYMPPAQPQYGGYPPPPQQQNPYNSSVPPVAVAEQGSGQQHGQEQGGGENKIAEGGKKFGKKLGNAAIFGAGATLGSNLVNSIF